MAWQSSRCDVALPGPCTFEMYGTFGVVNIHGLMRIFSDNDHYWLIHDVADGSHIRLDWQEGSAAELD